MRKLGTFIVVLAVMTALSFSPANAAAKKAPKKNTISWETLCAAVKVGEQNLGKPYKFGAKGPDAFDCSGLIRYIFKEAGATQVSGTSKSLAANEKWLKINRAQDLQAGDLIFWGDGNQVTHVGLYLGDDTFMDATTSGGGVAIRHLGASDPYFQAEFESSPTWLGRRLLDGPAPQSRVPLSNPPQYNAPYYDPYFSPYQQGTQIELSPIFGGDQTDAFMMTSDIIITFEQIAPDEPIVILGAIEPAVYYGQ